MHVAHLSTWLGFTELNEKKEKKKKVNNGDREKDSRSSRSRQSIHVVSCGNAIAAHATQPVHLPWSPRALAPCETLFPHSGIPWRRYCNFFFHSQGFKSNDDNNVVTKIHRERKMWDFGKTDLIDLVFNYELKS